MWVTYRAVSPLDDTEEDVRVWMSLHDGYVFGTAFYESDWISGPYSMGLVKNLPKTPPRRPRISV